MKTLISNGSYKFHLAPLAVEMERRGMLAAMLAAGWPKGWQKRFAEKRATDPQWRRFLDRGEPISDNLVWSSPLTEVLMKVGDQTRLLSQAGQQEIHRFAFTVFARMAGRALRELRPDIYHYRCCYGGGSLAVARRLGIPTLCDHSVAHPQVADFMVDHEGQYPPVGEDTIYWPLSRQAEADLKAADYVLVNSEFVKTTCVHAGMDPDRIHVVYLGVDDKFLEAVPTFDDEQVRSRAPRLLFAGGWQKRKGVRTLIAALDGMTQPWKMDIIAGVDQELQREPEQTRFFARPEVSLVGTLPRSELAAKLVEYPIFVFPSYCEGSARVIFEAMAAGCYVITTPNSGSIVENGVHGALVPPGDVAALRDAIASALAQPDQVARIGAANAQLVRKSYRQSHYADTVERVYEAILEKRKIESSLAKQKAES